MNLSIEREALVAARRLLDVVRAQAEAVEAQDYDIYARLADEASFALRGIGPERYHIAPKHDIMLSHRDT